ncbi:MAG: DUF4416 family protein [Planctomycetes bacterium]|nr:DUF4416 family protein [Planctomycetota bacterium]
MTSPPPAALVAGVLAGSEALLTSTRASLEREWGSVLLASVPRPWTESDYYAPEMGSGLLRQFLGFATVVPVDRLAALKRRAIEIEETFKAGAPVARPVNIDPGLLAPFNLTLASTKRSGHRVWVGEGIWAEITLTFRDGDFQPLPWTYPDYARQDTRDFLTAVRKAMLPRIRTA